MTRLGSWVTFKGMTPVKRVPNEWGDLSKTQSHVLICPSLEWVCACLLSEIMILKWEDGFKPYCLNQESQTAEKGRNYLKCWFNNKNVWVDFAEIMLPKFCVDMLHNQINCNVIVTSSGNDHICVFLWGEHKIIERGLHKLCILQMNITPSKQEKWKYKAQKTIVFNRRTVQRADLNQSHTNNRRDIELFSIGKKNL